MSDISKLNSSLDIYEAEVNYKEIEPQLNTTEDTSFLKSFATDVPIAVAEGVKDAGLNAVNGFIDLTNFVADTDIDQLELDLGLPEIETGGGRAVKTISQFLTGFVPAMGAARALPYISKAGMFLKGAASGAVADFFAFDGNEERLSAVIESYPALKNPITEYLKGDPEDSALEKRFKNTLEGAGLGALGEGLFKGVKLIKIGRSGSKVKQTANIEAAFKKDVQDLGGKEAAEVFERKLTDLPAVTRDSLIEIRSQALLSSPTTQFRNVFSNMAVVGNEVLESAIGRGITKLKGGRGIEAGETLALLNGYSESIGDALQYASKAFKTGDSVFGRTKVDWVNAVSAKNYGLSDKNILGKGIDALGGMIRVPGRALNAGDEFFKVINYNAHLRALATREGVRKGLSGEKLASHVGRILDRPPQELSEQALQIAKVNTFTNDLGAFADSIETLRREVPTMKLVVPFFRTLANISKFGLERFPATAPLFKSVRDDIAAGGARQAKALAKMGVGSLYGLAMLGLYQNGRVTGGGPNFTQTEGRNQLKQQQAAGWQPYSFKVGDTYIDYKGFDPIGNVFSLWADTFETINAMDDDDKDIPEIISSAIVATAEGLTNNTWAESVTDVLDIIRREDGKRLQSYASNLASSFVPNVLNSVSKASDGQIRIANDFVSKVKRKIPGLSQTLPQRFDLWGRPMEYDNSPVSHVVSPFRVRDFDPEPFEKDFLERDIVISTPSWSQWFSGMRVNLRDQPQIYTRFLEISGQITLDKYEGKPLRQYLNDLVSGNSKHSSIYNKLSDGNKGSKEIFIKRVVSDYRKAAREQVMFEFPQFKTEILSEKAEQQKPKTEFKQAKKEIKDLKEN